jgi:hypothetical protein
MLANLEITEYAKNITHLILDCEFLNLTDISLETIPEQESADS